MTDFSEYNETEETVIGVHSSGILLEEGMNMSLQRNYCSNCKRKTHCYVKVDKETREAIVHNTCTNQSCECKCKTHYACKQCGHLHPYGQKCNRIELEPIKNPENDANWEKLLASFKTEDKENETDAGESMNENL